MKKLLIFMIFMMGLFFSSCREEKSDPGYLAGIAAKGYYDLLLEGKYKEFVDGYNQPYRLPNGYQDQLLMNAKMFVEQQQDEHKGMVKVNVLNAKADTAHYFARWWSTKDISSSAMTLTANHGISCILLQLTRP